MDAAARHAALGVIHRPEDCPETLGEMKAAGFRINGLCRNRYCWRDLSADLEKLIERLGADCPLTDRGLRRIVCGKCGGRGVLWRVLEPTPENAGRTHIDWSGIPATRHPPPIRELPIDRYRRLAAEAMMTTTPGAVPSIDDPKRSPQEYEPPATGAVPCLRLRFDPRVDCYWWREVLRPQRNWDEVWFANDNGVRP